MYIGPGALCVELGLLTSGVFVAWLAFELEVEGFCSQQAGSWLSKLSTALYYIMETLPIVPNCSKWNRVTSRVEVFIQGLMPYGKSVLLLFSDFTVSVLTSAD